MAWSTGIAFGFLVISFTLGYWFGTKCVAGAEGCLTSTANQNTYSAGDALLIVFSLVMPSLNFNQIIISIEKLVLGVNAGLNIFALIDETPKIKS